MQAHTAVLGELGGMGAALGRGAAGVAQDQLEIPTIAATMRASELRSLVGHGIQDDDLLSLLARSGYDLATAANAFFNAASSSRCSSLLSRSRARHVTVATPKLVRFDFTRPCRSGGLPRFSSRSELRSHPQWRRYFLAVYGELPRDAESFPLCVSDFSMLYTPILSMLNITLPPPANRLCEHDGRSAWRPWSPSVLPPWTAYLLHYKPPRAPLPSHTYVEVMHGARSWESGFERHGMWFTVQSGTGVWFNLGRTIAFDYHDEGFRYFNAQWETDMAQNAAAAGYDSIQFIRGDNMSHPCCQRIGLAAQCFGLEFVATRLTGVYACGAPNGSSHAFRAGWNATRRCHCTEHTREKFVNCVGTASHCGASKPEKRRPKRRAAHRRASHANNVLANGAQQRRWMWLLFVLVGGVMVLFLALLVWLVIPMVISDCMGEPA